MQMEISVPATARGIVYPAQVRVIRRPPGLTPRRAQFCYARSGALPHIYPRLLLDGADEQLEQGSLRVARAIGDEVLG